ncbi:MAG: AraC family transcriptional regulator [Saprospiraceae bacterium]|nr:AraC family transcriptional regulator [Saprospiraceae bacterium]
MPQLFQVKNPILADYIKHISYSEFHSDKDQFILVVPDGMTELVIHLCGSYERKQKDDLSPKKIVSSHLIGLKTEACFVKPNPQMRSIAVRFKPGAIRYFTNTPMFELVNNSIEASLIFGKDIHKLEDKILNSSTCEEINAGIEKYLTEKMITNTKFAAITHRLNILYADPSYGFLDNIKFGHENYKSVEREFQLNVGISPKLFKRIIQFNYASAMITNPKSPRSLTEIGYISGYYDQSHFISNFKKFTFLTPKEYAKLNESMFTSNQKVINSQFKNIAD